MLRVVTKLSEETWNKRNSCFFFIIIYFFSNSFSPGTPPIDFCSIGLAPKLTFAVRWFDAVLAQNPIFDLPGLTVYFGGNQKFWLLNFGAKHWKPAREKRGRQSLFGFSFQIILAPQFLCLGFGLSSYAFTVIKLDGSVFVTGRGPLVPNLDR